MEVLRAHCDRVVPKYPQCREGMDQLTLELQQPEFLAAVEHLAAQHGWELQQLRTAEQPVSAFEHALLEEAIASREGDHPLFSLALMELALAKGYRSPWLQDNRARALVALDRLEEASAIWQQLACCADAALKAAALGMLKQLTNWRLSNSGGSANNKNRLIAPWPPIAMPILNLRFVIWLML